MKKTRHTHKTGLTCTVLPLNLGYSDIELVWPFSQDNHLLNPFCNKLPAVGNPMAGARSPKFRIRGFSY